MAEELQNYKLQLQQVEAGLQTDPGNVELLKLKDGLMEVIELTRDLLRTQFEEQPKSYVEPTAEVSIAEYYEEIEAALIEAEKLVITTQNWKPGDKCQAKWAEDDRYYDAVIEEIKNDGEVSVIFDAYKNRVKTSINELRECATQNEVFPSPNVATQVLPALQPYNVNVCAI